MWLPLPVVLPRVIEEKFTELEEISETITARSMIFRG